MSLFPRQANELDHAQLFDEGCVKTRLNELTQLFVSKIVKEDMERIADEHKRAFKTPPPYEHGDHLSILYEKFGAKAREQALKVLELERQNYVNFHTERFKNILSNIIKRLRYLVFVVDEQGKVRKIKQFMERVSVHDPNGNTSHIEDQFYVENHDDYRLRAIGEMTTRLAELNDYSSYFNEELSGLWQQANELANIETIIKEAKK